MSEGARNIIIIGGGLVGSLCACFLAAKGYKIEVYEAREDLRKAVHIRGRSINLALSHRGRRALRAVGLEETVLKNAIAMKGRMLHDVSGKTKAHIYDGHTNQCIYSVSRNLLNGLLLTAAEKYPNVKLFFQCKLQDVVFREGTCVILNLQTKNTFISKADVVIGADGAFSKVRRYMQQIPLFQFSQTYIEHGYIELTIPEERGHLMSPNHLHIWPRGEFMMIALPNKDGSWTVTLFMSLKSFQNIDDKDKLQIFFKATFPDAIDLIGKQELEEQFFSNPPSYLVSIKCGPLHFEDRVLIIGDAAHAMLPFYGQGMNCGFEDCSLLDHLLSVYGDNFRIVLEKFTQMRKDDVHAICDLAMYNFVEMRDLVTRPSYYLRKNWDSFLYGIFAEAWVPLYNSVSFTSIRYTECLKHRKWQNKVMRFGACFILIVFILPLFYIFFLR